MLLMTFFHNYVHQIGGLQLEGCLFDGMMLAESREDSPSVVSTPVCTVAWVSKECQPIYNPADSISLPVYYSADRYKLVTCLDMPIGPGTSNTMWIQSGAALFLKN